MTRFLSASVALAFSLIVTSFSGAAPFDHGLYDQLLHDHVQAGKVDYAALQHDKRLDTYLEQIAAADLDSQSEKFACWINAYTLQLIVSSYPVNSIKEIPAPGQRAKPDDKALWASPFAVVNHQALSLNAIENDIIRPEFQDPRIHFALVCAARSCAPLHSEAYVAAKLDDQLDVQARWFFRWLNNFDVAGRRAGLSPILDWYRDDFGSTDAALITYASRYVPTSIAPALAGQPGKWSITFQHYDWALNSQ
ncbi:MAG: DUF547 domain-containing protein [Candidatus Synoicihabitans palmerolidicus]|nr:DUF547 domain-containing protein [Candidatus Synoicihabitans palmerolidicus]